MKYWTLTIAIGVLAFIIMVIFSVPPLILLLSIPVLGVAAVYCTVSFNSRNKTYEMRPIPKAGYDSRLAVMDSKIKELDALGFRKVDQFYFKAVPDSVNFVFKHSETPTFFLLHHLGQKMACNIFTKYNDNFSLTTSESVESGLMPLPKREFLQIFPGKTYKDLFDQHQKSHFFLVEKGLRPFDIDGSEFRHYYLRGIKTNIANQKQGFLWPLVLFFRIFFQHSNKYCKSIIDQFASGGQGDAF